MTMGNIEITQMSQMSQMPHTTHHHNSQRHKKAFKIKEKDDFQREFSKFFKYYEIT